MVNVKNNPGNTAIHHKGLRKFSATTDIIFPQVGSLGVIPKTKKLNAASAKIAQPKLILATTSKGATH